MKNLIAYLNSERTHVQEQLEKLIEELNKSCYELENVSKMIVDYSKNVDTTYEVFSPNSNDQNFHVIEIEKLSVKKEELIQTIEQKKMLRDELIAKKENLKMAYDDFEEFQRKIEFGKIESEKKLKRELLYQAEDYKKEITTILEKQIRMDEHFLKTDVIRQLDILENKLSLCGNFVDMDLNRAKLELQKLGEEISYFKKRIQSELFHVKHYDPNVRVGLAEEIKSFVKDYKKSINSRVEFKYLGIKIDEYSYVIVNLIRIIKEAIDNADQYGGGTVINITVAVDEYAESFVDESSQNNEVTDLEDQDDINKEIPYSYLLELENSNEKIVDKELKEYLPSKKSIEDNPVDMSQQNGDWPNDISFIDLNDSNEAGQDKNVSSQTQTNEAKNSDSQDEENDQADSDEINSYDHLLHRIYKKSDMHPINFVINEPTDRFLVTVKISDNGEGFHLINSQLLEENDMYGISMMKYRTSQLKGRFEIRSEEGIGTTVTIAYLTK